MRDGKGSTQPDKAGNFGFELVNLYKITKDTKYLDAALRIANTLSNHTTTGDSLRSPLPFRVNAKTGKAGRLFSNTGSGKEEALAVYTSNWTGTLLLFEALKELGLDKKGEFTNAHTRILCWMKAYPLRTNTWGPFFEDIPGWSDTQTNAISFAMYMLSHRELFPDWKKQVAGIFQWTYKELGNTEYSKYKVTVMNEQTVYRVPGNSHSSRQASAEILYTVLSGDSSFLENALRTLNWATYTVDRDGKNKYIRDDIWLTDGYGDYVRHYLRSMAAMSSLAPAHKNRMLYASSVVRHIEYTPAHISYETFDPESTEQLRLKHIPVQVLMSGEKLEMNTGSQQGWSWKAMDKGGLLEVRHTGGKNIVIQLL
jgi:hypothetical protein